MNHPLRFHLIAAFCCATASPLAAQTTAPNVGFLDVGSEREAALRVLQITGDVPLYPWTMRQLAPSEEDRLVPKDSEAAALLPPEPKTHAVGSFRYEVLPIETGVVYNSAFPYGFNDGPLWAGRGFTASLSAGVAARMGPLSVQFEPMVFEAQNQAFPLMPTGNPANPYLNGFYPTSIDLPQRFGNQAYRRFDPGQSTARIDLGPLFVDVSTADQWWGPAVEEPLILGDNAPGFLHASVGSARPINLFIGKAQGRVVYGRLEQSPYSPNQGPDSVRFMAGLVGSFTPRGVPGLELGAARFFHAPWPTDGFAHASFGLPFEGLLKQSLATSDNPTGEDTDNQLASLYARWVLPRSGVELYGEYGREDHNVDLRDLWQEPDHAAGYTIGMQRAWKRSSEKVLVVRGEILNTRLSPLIQGRGEAAWYVHQTLTQGHTDLGQLLGAPGGEGGGAANAAADLYTSHGKWTLEFDRIARDERSVANTLIPMHSDILESLAIRDAIQRGAVSYDAGLQPIWDLNRDFGGDRFNLNLQIGARVLW